MRLEHVLVAVALVFYSGPTWAQPRASGATLDRMLPEIRAQHLGRLSEAETHVGPDGQKHYRVKWVTPRGQILFFDVNSNTGHHQDTADVENQHPQGP